MDKSYDGNQHIRAETWKHDITMEILVMGNRMEKTQ
jgi:hypothetical protein